MSNTQNTKSGQQSKESKPTKAKGAKPDEPTNEEKLEQALADLAPVLEFHKSLIDFLKSHEGMTMDDVRMCWNVRVMRGADKLFAHSKGTSPLVGILAENRMIDATSTVENEILNKITLPIVGAIQAEVNRFALARRREKEESELDPPDLMDDDLMDEEQS